MSNLGLLMKTTIINELGINKLKIADKKEKAKAIGMIVLIGTSFLILGAYGFMLCLYLSDLLLQINQMELLLIMGIIGCTFATFFTSLYKASSYLFYSRDYEMLASLPIKNSTILSSKILMLIFNNYLFAGAFVIIPGIVYFIKVKTSILFIPFLIILTLATPLIPTVVSSLIALLITNISSRSKKNNLVSIVLNIAMVVFLIGLSSNIQNIVEGLIENSSSIINMTQKIYPPAFYFVDALQNNNIMSLLLFLIISLLPITIFVYLFASNFNKINGKLSESYKSNNYKFKDMKTSTPVIALLKKEAKRYFSSTVYVMNTSIGMILLPLFTVLIIIVGYDKIAQMLEISVIVDMIKIQIIGITVFCIIMSNTSSVSVSIEGKNLWILKSSPIREMDIFKGKILLNIILIIPISIISFIPLAVKLNFGIMLTIIFIISIILLALFSSSLGLLINLMYPKLDFTSDVAAVKKGASVIITMICNILYIAIICVIGYVFKINNIEIFLMIGNIITLAVIVMLYVILKTKGVKLFRAL